MKPTSAQLRVLTKLAEPRGHIVLRQLGNGSQVCEVFGAPASGVATVHLNTFRALRRLGWIAGESRTFGKYRYVRPYEYTITDAGREVLRGR